MRDLRPTRTNRAARDLPPELWSILRDHCQRAARNGSPSTSETLHQAENGERWLRLNAAPSGDLVVATVTDVTASSRRPARVDETRREAERQREETLAAGEAKSRFLATMSHELRTPMNAILGFADLLKSYTLDQQQIAYVEIIRRSGQDLLRVLNDILDFSKIDAGFLTLERTPYNPASLARDIVMLFAKTARDRETSLFVSSDPDVPEWIEGDVTRIRQVLSNLIGNACKFTEDGRIDVRVSPGPDGMIEFAIMDSGIGMTSEQLRRIFQPFVQADETTTRRFGGTGLGLAISKRLVEAMGGIGAGHQHAGRRLRLPGPHPRPRLPAAGLCRRGGGRRSGGGAGDPPGSAGGGQCDQPDAGGAHPGAGRTRDRIGSGRASGPDGSGRDGLEVRRQPAWATIWS